MSTPQIQVNILIRACYAALRRTDSQKSRLTAAGSATAPKREYYDALTQADRALELALDSGLDDGVVRQCEILQGFCENLLRSAYGARFDSYERRVYERAAAASAADDDDESSSEISSSDSSDSDEGRSSSADERGEAPEPSSKRRLRWAI